jgi:Spy/CpxP family protein refolding chaperone
MVLQEITTIKLNLFTLRQSYKQLQTKYFKKMKNLFNFRSIGLAILVSIFALNISAQGPGGGRQMTEEDIKERSENTAKTLGLNKDQHKKIEAVDMDFYNKMQIERQKMRSAGGPPAEGDRQAMREKMGKMMDDRNAQYEEILTPDQYKKFIEIQEQRRNEMREQRQQSNPDSGGSEKSERGRGRN